MKFTKGIAAFDIETKQFEKEKINGIDLVRQEFLCGSVAGDNGTRFFRDKEEMQEYVLSYLFRGYYIYATNLEFDFLHLFQGSKHFKNFRIIDRNGIIYAKYKEKHDEEGHSVREFLDTWNYTGRISVEKMGDFLGIKKLSYPKAFKRVPESDEEWEEMKNYNINDSLITYKFAVFYCRNFCPMINAIPKITLASTGQDFWRRNYLDRDIFQEPKETILMHYQGSMHGGRTEVIKRGTIDRKIWGFDFNSHYPARCYEGIDGKGCYPLPSSSHRKDWISPNIIDSYEGITRCCFKAPYMHIPLLGITSHMGRYIFPTGEINGWFTNQEIRLAIDNGYELMETFEGVYYHETFVPFREAVKFLYSKRKEYKENGDELMSMMTKTIMNSGLFGKFAQKIDKRTDIIHQDNIIIKDDGMLEAINEFNEIIRYESYYHKGDIFLCSKTGSDHIPIFIMPILASYTTALGRIELWKNVYKIGKYIIYMDTDSIYVLKNCFNDSSDLGELKLEFVADGGIFIKPKFYSINIPEKTMFKIKGMGKKVDLDIFNSILNENRQNYEKFSRFKESLTRKIPFSSIINTTKDFSLEDSKREWHKRFRIDEIQESDPLDLKDGFTEKEILEHNRKSFEKLKEQKIEELKKTDFFDSKGDDITDEEFMENEIWK
jgi:hypothetical protein